MISQVQGMGIGPSQGLNQGTLCFENTFGGRKQKGDALFHCLPLCLSLQMGNQNSAPHEFPLSCILLNQNKFNTQKEKDSSPCATAWPQYKLGDRESWAENDSLNILFYHQTFSVTSQKHGKKCHMFRPLGLSETTLTSVTPARQIPQFQPY